MSPEDGSQHTILKMVIKLCKFLRGISQQQIQQKTGFYSRHRCFLRTTEITKALTMMASMTVWQIFR